MFQIKWTPEAEQRYLEILEFWIAHNQSTSYSLKIIEEVEQTEVLLAVNPLIGVKIAGTKNTIRRIIILKDYSIFYRIKENVVEIVSFWANKMNPEDLKIK